MTVTFPDLENRPGNYIKLIKMVNDPIADLLTRIKNATVRHNKQIVVPSSHMLVSIANILKEENFVDEVTEIEDEKQPQGQLIIKLKYDGMQPAIQHAERVSKSGLRKYVSYKDIKPVLNGLGIGIISTSKGVMTDKNAIAQKMGGEYLCKLW
jgi:small subunit ribosomal protein S8